MGVFLAAAVALWNTAIAVNLCLILAYPMKMRNFNIARYNHGLVWFGSAVSCAV